MVTTHSWVADSAADAEIDPYGFAPTQPGPHLLDSACRADVVGQAGGRQRRQARQGSRYTDRRGGTVGAPAISIGVERICRADPQCVVRSTEWSRPERLQEVVRQARRPGGGGGARPRRRPARAPTGRRGARAGPPRCLVRAAAANAATTSRRRAPPCGVSEMIAAKRCSSSTAGPGGRRPPAARVPRSHRRLGPAAPTRAASSRVGRRRRFGRTGGRPGHAGRPSRVRASLVHAGAGCRRAREENSPSSSGATPTISDGRPGGAAQRTPKAAVRPALRCAP